MPSSSISPPSVVGVSLPRFAWFGSPRTSRPRRCSLWDDRSAIISISRARLVRGLVVLRVVARSNLRISRRYNSIVCINRAVWRCLDDAQIEIESSLMMYPIPNPSPDVGPKPKCRRHGLPQFEVDRIVLLILSQPGSLKMAGVAGTGRMPRRLKLLAEDMPSSDTTSESLGESMPEDPFSPGLE